MDQIKIAICNANDRPALVIFDLFGTLIEYGVMRHPFRRLLKWARESGRRPTPDDARILMTTNGDVRVLAAALGIEAPWPIINQIQLDIQEELDSLALFNDVVPTLDTLRLHKIPFAICSNLASPYGKAIDLLLEDYSFARALSYETGFIKPEIGIYNAVVAQALVPPEKCLFIGDTLLADYVGPRQFGMQAYHLMRDSPSGDHIINALTDIFDR